MNIQDMLITMDQTSDVSQPSLFPFPPGLHMGFVAVAVIFFAYRFYTQRRPYQLLIAAAIFVSLGFLLSESKALYYGIGVIQLLLLIAAAVTSIVCKPAEMSPAAAGAGEVSHEEEAEDEAEEEAEEEASGETEEE